MTENDRPEKPADRAGAPDQPKASEAAGAERAPDQAEAGTDGGAPPPDRSADTEKRRRGGRGALLIAVLALLVALAAAGAVAVLGYFGQQRADALGERVATAESAVESNMQDVILPRIRELEARVEELDNTVDQRGGALSRLQEGLRQTQNQITELAELVEGGRRHWRLLELEDLMVAANQRLQLHRDAEGARQALELVNRRLGKLNDPRLFDIRETVVDEIAALEALPSPDIEGLALSLTSLSEQVREFPLASDVPDEYAGGDPAGDDAAQPGVPAWRHFLNSVGEALDGMLTVRRSEGQYKPLMPPEQEFFLHQNLQLKLQAARLALLEREAESYRANLASAREWLQTFYDTGDSGVSAAVEKLGQMQKVRIDWQAPDIGGSLAALREFLDERGDSGSQAPPSGDGEERAAAESGDSGGE